MHNSSRAALIALGVIKNAREEAREAKWFIKEKLSQPFPEGLGPQVYVSESIMFSYLFAENDRKTEGKYIEYHNPFSQRY